MRLLEVIWGCIHYRVIEKIEMVVQSSYYAGA